MSFIIDIITWASFGMCFKLLIVFALSAIIAKSTGSIILGKIETIELLQRFSSVNLHWEIVIYWQLFTETQQQKPFFDGFGLCSNRGSNCDQRLDALSGIFGNDSLYITRSRVIELRRKQISLSTKRDDEYEQGVNRG